jgi:hypothetical protein
MRFLARQQLAFTVGVLVCGVLEAAVAGSWVGRSGVEGVVYSILLCLVPGWLTILVGHRLRRPEYAGYTLLVGTAARVAFVLVGLLVLGAVRPDLGFRQFGVWLVIGYLVSLVLETWAVVALLKTNSE